MLAEPPVIVPSDVPAALNTVLPIANAGDPTVVKTLVPVVDAVNAIPVAAAHLAVDVVSHVPVPPTQYLSAIRWLLQASLPLEQRQLGLNQQQHLQAQEGVEAL